MPFVRSIIMFLCSSRAQMFLASCVGQPASLSTVPIRLRPISSARSPFSIISMTFSSSGSICTQNLLCLLGLFAMASMPWLATLSRYTTIGREVMMSIPPL